MSSSFFGEPDHNTISESDPILCGYSMELDGAIGCLPVIGVDLRKVPRLARHGSGQ